jgi:hypothetical protein
VLFLHRDIHHGVWAKHGDEELSTEEERCGIAVGAVKIEQELGRVSKKTQCERRPKPTWSWRKCP